MVLRVAVLWWRWPWREPAVVVVAVGVAVVVTATLHGEALHFLRGQLLQHLAPIDGVRESIDSVPNLVRCGVTPPARVSETALEGST